jgi:hypothetical protein
MPTAVNNARMHSGKLDQMTWRNESCLQCSAHSDCTLTPSPLTISNSYFATLAPNSSVSSYLKVQYMHQPCTIVSLKALSVCAAEKYRTYIYSCLLLGDGYMTTISEVTADTQRHETESCFLFLIIMLR